MTNKEADKLDKIITILMQEIAGVTLKKFGSRLTHLAVKHINDASNCGRECNWELVANRLEKQRTLSRSHDIAYRMHITLATMVVEEAKEKGLVKL